MIADQGGILSTVYSKFYRNLLIQLSPKTLDIIISHCATDDDIANTNLALKQVGCHHRCYRWLRVCATFHMTLDSLHPVICSMMDSVLT